MMTQPSLTKQCRWGQCRLLIAAISWSDGFFCDWTFITQLYHRFPCFQRGICLPCKPYLSCHERTSFTASLTWHGNNGQGRVYLYVLKQRSQRSVFPEVKPAEICVGGSNWKTQFRLIFYFKNVQCSLYRICVCNLQHGYRKGRARTNKASLS